MIGQTVLSMPQAPIDHPAAWVGRELRKSEHLWKIELDEREHDELASALDRVRDAEIDQITSRNFELITLGPVMRAVARQLEEGVGAILLRNFPTEGFSVEDVTRMYYGLSTHLGIPVAQNAAGKLIDSVRNEGGPAAGPTVRSYKTARPLTYHNDLSDIVGLLCLKPAKEGGVSRVISAVELHNVIARERPDLLETLYREPYFQNWRGEGPMGQAPVYWARIFSWYEGRLSTHYSNRSITEAQEHYGADVVPRLTPAQAEALSFIEEVCGREELPLDMSFRPGDIQYLNNFSVWHSRTGFVDHDDPAERRHLLRVWLAQPNGRRLADDHLNRYDCLGEHGKIPRRRTFDVPINPLL